MTDETNVPEEATDKSVDKGDYVAPETGDAPTATAYLGNDEWTGTEPILQGSPYYHNGRLITTQKELDEIRAEFEKYVKDDSNVVNSEDVKAENAKADSDEDKADEKPAEDSKPVESKPAAAKAAAKPATASK